VGDEIVSVPERGSEAKRKEKVVKKEKRRRE